MIKRPGYGPRIFLRADIHAIITKTFTDLQSEPYIYVYGEGSWGGDYTSQRLEPHKTHKNGRYLDIFMPVKKNGKAVYFPTSEADVFGYAVNFSAKGKGEGKHKDLEVDWRGLQALIASLCENSGTKIKTILIARDMFSFVRTTIFTV